MPEITTITRGIIPMCFITAKNEQAGGTQDLTIHQIIEAIAYEKINNRARIIVDCWVENNGQSNASLLLIHPGKVSLESNNDDNLLRSAERFVQVPELQSDLSQENLLYLIYKDRIGCISENKKQGFARRINCYRQEEHLTGMDNAITNEGLSVSAKSFPADSQVSFYTTISVKNLQPGKSWFRVVVLLKEESYQKFVGDVPHFWIEGPSKVIEFLKEDIAHSNKTHLASIQNNSVSIFDFFTAGKPKIIIPEAYDIVIFRKGTKGVENDVFCDPITSDVYRAQIKDPIADNHAYLFVSRSPEFWIDVCYEGDPRLAPIENVFISQEVK
jgi:hypothetical protein